MELKQRIRDDMKVAQKEAATGPKTRLSTLRLLMASIKNAEIEKGDELEDAEVVEIVGREVKRRREAISEFRKGQREDLAKKEEDEKAVLQGYLPPQLSDMELDETIAGVVKDTGAASPKDMGRVMGAVMPLVKGRADGRLVQEKVRALLQDKTGAEDSGEDS